MILVTLGTQHQEFTRLLDYIEKSKIKDKIIVQAGYTKYKSKKMKMFDFIDYDKMAEYVKDADLIITHGGTGSITGPLKEGKKVIACARLAKYGEHVDDHQSEIVDVFSDEGYILKLDESTNLDDLIKKAKAFNPKEFKSNTKNFINKLTNEIDSTKKKNKDVVFLALFLMMISLGFVTLVRTPKDISEIENRTLNKFKIFQVKDFLSKDFQDNLEDALSDQFVGSQTTKKVMNSIENFVNPLNAPKSICQNNYVLVKDNFYTFDCDDHLLEMPVYKDLSNNDYLRKRINEFNVLNEKVDTYYYVINRSFNYDFRNNTVSLDLVSFMNNNLKENKGLNYLRINSYNDYKNYFYKTDHHWNYKGSYQGYKDIMSMFDIKDIKVPIEEVTFNGSIWYGSTARNLSLWSIKEQFTVYEFKFDNHNEYINGNVGEYGNQKKFLNLRNKKFGQEEYYAKFYGYDIGEIIYDYHDDAKDNLLILSSSFSNPINGLIASHFNRTYVIDGRHYNDFKVFDYIEKNNINKVLIIMDFNFVSMSAFGLGVE